MAENDNDKHIYQTRSVVIKRGDLLYDYCDQTTALTNNLENAVLFRFRQVMFGVAKEPSSRHANEIEVLNEIESALPAMGDKFKMPTKGKFFLSYQFLEKLFSVTLNSDRFATGLSNHTAQNAIKTVVRNMRSYFSSLKKWKKNPDKFTDKPGLMDYHRKGGHCTAIISNQEAVLNNVNGKWFLKLPYISNKEFWVPFGESCPGVRLKEVTITPENGTYVITAVLQTLKEKPALISDKPERIAAVDLGVDNLMAVTNNCGYQSILYSGKVCKSVNQKFNKRAAEIISEQTLKTGKKFVPTAEYQRILNKRNNQIDDIMKKTAKHFVQWCVENRIDTVVIGCNKGQKQGVELGNVNNQNFVQIPFFKLRKIISYLCERSGIRYVEQEESYTSKASFIDGDYIPVYGVDDCNANFSGKRRPTHYRGMYNKKGFRGLYKTKDGMIINSDLNGSANILRKAFPDAFKNGIMPDFGMPLIFKHTDLITNLINNATQTLENLAVSKSRLGRINKKYALL